jgi:hypothetical protein
MLLQSEDSLWRLRIRSHDEPLKISDYGEQMLLRRVSKRHVIFNGVFRSWEIERLHSLRFDSLRQDEIVADCRAGKGVERVRVGSALGSWDFGVDPGGGFRPVRSRLMRFRAGFDFGAPPCENRNVILMSRAISQRKTSACFSGAIPCRPRIATSVAKRYEEP